MGLNKQLLERTLTVQAELNNDLAMRLFLFDELNKIDGVTWGVDKGNIYAAKGLPTVGAFYPCYVAHMDATQPVLDGDEWMVLKAEGIWFGWNPVKERQEGVGGDDKVGVFLLLECLKRLPACKAVFFRDSGNMCLGASFAKIPFFDDCSFVLEPDRRGNEDFSSHSGAVKLHGAEFGGAMKPMLDRFKFKAVDWGLETDVKQLRLNGLEIASAVVACGYHSPRTPEEFVREKDVSKCLSLLLAAARTISGKQWEWLLPKKAVQTAWPNADVMRVERDLVAKSICPICATKPFSWDGDAREWYCAKCNCNIKDLALFVIEKRTDC